MPREKIIGIAIIMALSIALSTFPIDLIVNDIYLYYVLEMLLVALILLFTFIYIRRNPSLVPYQKKVDYKTLALFAPTLLVCISNFIYAFIIGEPQITSFSNLFYLRLGLIILTSISEELIFRHLLLGNMYYSNPLKSITISAAIFGLCHLTHFFATLDPINLIDVVYTFALGMLLGFVYYYSHSLVACIGIHFAFNFLNDLLFVTLFPVTNQLWYYLINAFVAIIVGIYVLVVYLLKLRKTPQMWD